MSSRAHFAQMGFEAAVVDAIMGDSRDSSATRDAATSAVVQAATAVVTVKGMTCNSCVQNIEGVMSDKPGVLDIAVSLANEEAIVHYDPTVLTPQAIADAIDDVCCSPPPVFARACVQCLVAVGVWKLSVKS